MLKTHLKTLTELTSMFLMWFNSAPLDQPSSARSCNKLPEKPEEHGYLSAINEVYCSFWSTLLALQRSMFLFFVAIGNEKMKGLGGQEALRGCGWMVALVARQKRKEHCPVQAGRSGARQDEGSFPTHPLAFLGLCQLCPRVLGERKAVHHLCLHRDWPLFFLFRGSKILCTGPEGKSLQILPTTTDSECSVCGWKASPHLLPLLGFSPCWQSLFFHKHPPAVGFSLLCV